MTPNEYCKERAAKSGSSFYYSFLFLPTEQRHAIMALYAFCREIDDVVDECKEPAIAQQKLDWWRGEVEALYNGRAQHPVTIALSSALSHFSIQQQHMLALIDGMQMDLYTNTYQDFDELYQYCYRAAGVVGLMSAEIFGYQNQETLKYAEYLGIAFQLTNILRDIKEDYTRDRIYIPANDFQQFSLTPAELIANQTRDAEKIQAFLKFQAERAQSWYEKAFHHLSAEDRRNQRSGIIMAAIYNKVLGKITRRPDAVLSSRVQLSPLHKLWIAWRTYRKEHRSV